MRGRVGLKLGEGVSGGWVDVKAGSIRYLLLRVFVGLGVGVGVRFGFCIKLKGLGWFRGILERFLFLEVF